MCGNRALHTTAGATKETQRFRSVLGVVLRGPCPLQTWCGSPDIVFLDKGQGDGCQLATPIPDVLLHREKR